MKLIACACLDLRAARNRTPCQRIRAIDQGERRQNGAFFAKSKMSTESAAPFGCIIHARQVVEQKGRGVEVLERNSELSGRSPDPSRTHVAI